MRSILTTVVLTAVGCLLADTALAACPVCFQMEEGPVADGVRAAVLVLMGVTVVVLSGFGVGIARFVRRTSEPENLGTPERNPEPPEPRNPGTS